HPTTGRAIEIIAATAHLQAELERVCKDRDDWKAVADTFDRQLDKMRIRAEAAEARCRELQAELEQRWKLIEALKSDLIAEAARCRVLEEALRAMFDAAKTALGNTRLPYEWHEKSPMALAERALAGQEEK